MPNVTLYDSDYITVEYWPDKALIYHTIHQPMSNHLAEFKEALNAGTDALQKYKVRKWLSDDRKNDSLTPEGNDWSLNEWQPRTIKAGWQYWAMVVPEDLAAAGTLMPVIDILFELGLRMMVFTNREQAIAWLDKIENPST
ncbi:MAG TPA: hypothetical protein VHO69_15645 [Phototrophicaceae bacterium]|nr:hypothetical protein [Phototrophicaceae bacterium]